MISITESNTNNTGNQSGIYSKKKVRYNLSNNNGEGDELGETTIEDLVS